MEKIKKAVVGFAEGFLDSAKSRAVKLVKENYKVYFVPFAAAEKLVGAAKEEIKAELSVFVDFEDALYEAMKFAEALEWGKINYLSPEITAKL